MPVPDNPIEVVTATISTNGKAKNYYTGVRQKCFQPGQWVYYYCPRRHIRQSPKWTRFYSRPYLVEAATGPVNYVIRRSHRSQPTVAHVDKLKPYCGERPRSWLSTTDSSSELLTPEADCRASGSTGQGTFRDSQVQPRELDYYVALPSRPRPTVQITKRFQ